MNKSIIKWKKKKFWSVRSTPSSVQIQHRHPGPAAAAPRPQSAWERDSVTEVKLWVHENILKSNDDKTEGIMINPKKYDIPFDQLTVGTDVIGFAESAKNLGVHIDEDLSMNATFLIFQRLSILK